MGRGGGNGAWTAACSLFLLAFGTAKTSCRSLWLVGSMIVPGCKIVVHGIDISPAPCAVDQVSCAVLGRLKRVRGIATPRCTKYLARGGIVDASGLLF